MADHVLAAVRTAPSTTELREFPIPDIPADGALLKVEIAGICGTDVKMYGKPPFPDPVIMGHENVGVIARAGREFTARKGLREGDRVFVEHYVGCFRCAWCHAGEYRHCEATDWRTNPDARRYGYTSAENPYHLWGGFSQYLYLPWNAVTHRVPEGVTPELAGLVTPLSNGIEWALVTAGVGYASTVLIQGPASRACRRLSPASRPAPPPSSSPAPRATPHASPWPVNSAPTTPWTSPRTTPSNGSSTSPPDAAWTSSSTAPRAPVPPLCCSASMPSSAARA
ncbi:hypothetical protein GCM10017744_004630 [Streptomyces antimycoticus]